MLVRCGYEWTGHPGVDDDGRLKSLHGRVQNIPASVVSVTIDEEPPYAIHVLGRVDERTVPTKVPTKSRSSERLFYCCRTLNLSDIRRGYTWPRFRSGTWPR
ncbi:DUF4432 family protein [Aeromonas caviae]